jgi:mRNA-degrading endonuclease RelE of RelBE toxin-antitoxin system
VAAALQIWSPTFSRSVDNLPSSVRADVERKVDEMGTRLESFPHKRLQGRPEFKLRVGDFRLLDVYDVKLGRIYLHYVGNRREINQRSRRGSVGASDAETPRSTPVFPAASAFICFRRDKSDSSAPSRI